MNSPSHGNLEPIESQIARVPSGFAPTELRATVLGKVHRELRASRWDRRFGRAVAVLLVVGVVMNVVVIGKHTSRPAGRLALRPTPQVIAKLAVNVAEATDAKTARTIAFHLATFGGMPLSDQQTAAIRHEIDRRLPPTTTNGKDG